MTQIGGCHVDVVIPVYNAAELTRRCIDSIYDQLGDQLGDVCVHDDGSDEPTARMLDALSHPRLYVHHASENTGFGNAVNQGVARARTELVLVLNSDIRAQDDFLEPLVAAMRADSKLAAVVPAGNTFHHYDFSRYEKSGECVVTYNLYAYAFLLRRSAFEEVGAFDPVYGPGFFEDVDLSRRLVRAGWWLGIHPKASLHHEIHGSFNQVAGFRERVAKNREIYYGRYPQARRQIVLVTGRAEAAELPAELRAQLDGVLREGGGALWLAPGSPRLLPALQVRGARLCVASALRAILRRRRKPFKRYSELWLGDGAPARAAAPLARACALLGLQIRRFPSPAGANPA